MKHGNVNPDVNSGNPEVDSDYAKHGNVNPDVDSGNPDVDSVYVGCVSDRVTHQHQSLSCVTAD
ncbi:hypothetical protein [Tolypothrix sp. PCC 7910]|uniref:hypothetical protein n=1 Tax=Tolypothrix sp. PCC 7910 TaxID=2099387 RepID=UPI001AD780F5|nr:hypothetical protein [Tolypothrix sp. PCC 7910]